MRHVAYRRGSMAEVVDVGVTGYLVHDVASAAAAVDRATQLDRSAVRARACLRFGAARMVEDYIRTYQALLTQQPGRTDHCPPSASSTSSRATWATPIRASPIP